MPIIGIASTRIIPNTISIISNTNTISTVSVTNSN